MMSKAKTNSSWRDGSTVGRSELQEGEHRSKLLLLSSVCEVPSSKGCRGSTHPAATQSNYFQTGSETHSAKGPKGEVVSVPGHCPGTSAQGIVSTPSWVKGSPAGSGGPPGADISPWDLTAMKDRRHLLSK